MPDEPSITDVDALLERVDLLEVEEGPSPLELRFADLADHARKLRTLGYDRGLASARLADLDRQVDAALLAATEGGLTWPQAFEALTDGDGAKAGLPNLDQLYRRARGGSKPAAQVVEPEAQRFA